jgi:hypothetical protein
MTSQQLHDQKLKKALPKLDLKGSRKTLEDLLEKKNANSSNMSQSQPQGAIARAMKRFSGLTREEAEELAATQGF